MEERLTSQVRNLTLGKKKAYHWEVKTQENFRSSYHNIYPRGCTADQETLP